MRYAWIKQSLLSVGFIVVTFSSPQNFVITNADNRIIANGTAELVDNFALEVSIIMDGKTYRGAGEVYDDTYVSILKKKKQGIRADTALLETLTKGHSKHAEIAFNTVNGTNLACKFNTNNEKIGGYCIHSPTQQTLTIKPSTKESVHES